MSAITTPRLSESTDSFLRFAMRADAVCSGLMGIAGIPLAGWLAETSRHPNLFRVLHERVLHRFRGRRSSGSPHGPLCVRPAWSSRSGMWCTPSRSIALVLADVFPLTTIGVVLTLATGVYTLVMAELQYQGVRRIK